MAEDLALRDSVRSPRTEDDCAFLAAPERATLSVVSVLLCFVYIVAIKCTEFKGQVLFIIFNF